MRSLRTGWANVYSLALSVCLVRERCMRPDSRPVGPASSRNTPLHAKTASHDPPAPLLNGRPNCPHGGPRCVQRRSPTNQSIFLPRFRQEEIPKFPAGRPAKSPDSCVCTPFSRPGSHSSSLISVNLGRSPIDLDPSAASLRSSIQPRRGTGPPARIIRTRPRDRGSTGILPVFSRGLDRNAAKCWQC